MKMKNLMRKAHFLFFSILFGSICTNAQDYETGFQFRARLLLDTLSRRQQPGSSGFTCTGAGDYGKFFHPAFMGRLNQNPMDTVVANRMIFYAVNCDLFHFNFPGLIRLLYLYPCNPGFTDNVKRQYLNLVFNRNDRYNAFTGEGTENHVNMNRTSGYLFAQYALQHYPNDYPTASLRMAEMKTWILYFAKRIYEAGTGEWNSNTYHPYNIHGWVNLYDFARDSAVKQAAKAVLDYYATELAIYYTQGITGGASSRGSSVLSFNREADFLGWLWFDDSPRNYALPGFVTPGSNLPLPTAFFATSTYRPPMAVVRLAQKRSLQAHFKIAYPTYLLDSIGYVQADFYIDRNFTLGTAYTPYGGWGGGSTQILNWKLVVRVDSSGTVSNNSAQILTGNGGYNISGGHPTNLDGQRRLPFEQFAQYKNVLVQMTKVPTTPNTSAIQSIFTTWQSNWFNDFVQRFPTGDNTNPVNIAVPNSLNRNHSFISYRKDIANPPTFEIDNSSNTLIIQYAKVYVTVKSIFQNLPIVTTSHSQYNYFRDTATTGNLIGFVVEVFNAEDFAGYTDFKTKVLPKISLDKSQVSSNQITYYTYAGDTLQVQYQPSGTFTEPMFDWGYGPTTQQIIPKSPPFIQPTFPNGIPNGRLATWTVNSVPMNAYQRAIFKGKYVQLENSILLINDSAGNCYKVDYTGSAPIFSTCGTPNALPTDILLTHHLLQDSVPANTFVGKLSASDSDNDFYRFMLYDSAGKCNQENHAFRISRDSVYTRRIITASENLHWRIFVRGDDNKGGYYDKLLSFQINLPPTNIILSNATISENNAVNQVIGTFTATDTNQHTIVFSLVNGVGGEDNSKFTISGNQLLANHIFDYETKKQYSIRIRATDVGGLFFEKVFFIQVTDINEIPTNIHLSSTSVTENNPIPTIVGTLTAVDVDTLENFTFSLVPGSGDSDNLSFYISGNSLQTSERFHYDIKNSYSIRIRVTDKGGLSFEKSFFINVERLLAERSTSLLPFTIFPNPTKNAITILTNSEISDIFLTDVHGKTILEGARSTELNLKTLPRGVYFVHLIIENKKYVVKVVKED
ncbi:MAG: T9SS type A sorting domain-containing protein [Cytophagales bacterium]|nr:T9SS type A sorting domain-containing protein [Cytophagales bacterium]MDW8384839.1 T9SS type A sorting domain-containing protein [Flammeovirgaceae bacterium]